MPDAEKEASWLYLKYLTNTKNTAYFAAQTGYIPVRKSAKDDPVFAEVLPLTLEEIFISETEAAGYDIKDFLY